MKQFVAGIAVAVLGLGLFSQRSTPQHVVTQPLPQNYSLPIASMQPGSVPAMRDAPAEMLRDRSTVSQVSSYPVATNLPNALRPATLPVEHTTLPSSNQQAAYEEFLLQRQSMVDRIVSLPQHGNWGGHTVAPAEREGLTPLPANEAKWEQWRIDNGLPKWVDSVDRAYFFHDLRLKALRNRYPQLVFSSEDIEVGFANDQLARDLKKALDDDNLSLLTRMKTQLAATFFGNFAKYYSVWNPKDPAPARTKVFGELTDLFEQVRLDPKMEIAKTGSPGTVSPEPTGSAIPMVQQPKAAQPTDAKPSGPDGPRTDFDNFSRWWTKMTPQELEKAKAADPEGWKKHLEYGLSQEEFRKLQEGLKAQNPEIFGKQDAKAKPGTEPAAGKPLPDDLRKLLAGKNVKEVPSVPAKRSPQDQLLDSVRVPQGTPVPVNPIIRGSTPEDRVRIVNDAQPQAPAPAPVYQSRPNNSQPVYQGVRTVNDQGTTRRPVVGPGYGPGTGKSGPEGQRPITVHTAHEPNPNAVPTPVISIRKNTPTQTPSAPPVTQTPGAPPINQITKSPQSNNGTAPNTGPWFSFDDNAPKTRPGQSNPASRPQTNAPPPGTEPVVRDTPRPNPSANPVTQNPTAHPTTLPNGQKPIQFTPVKPVDVAPIRSSTATPPLKGVRMPLEVDKSATNSDPASAPSNLKDRILKGK